MALSPLQDPLIFKIINHSYYQRLRRIYQMALAHLVYPGAVHTRFHHSLGAYHLMCNAISELCSKGVEITRRRTGGKGCHFVARYWPWAFSHALENVLLQGMHHETLVCTLCAC